jgi:hypothetical protein
MVPQGCLKGRVSITYFLERAKACRQNGPARPSGGDLEPEAAFDKLNFREILRIFGVFAERQAIGCRNPG